MELVDEIYVIFNKYKNIKKSNLLNFELCHKINLINNKNLIIVSSPIFRYKGINLCVNEDYLSMEKITRALKENYLVFLYETDKNSNSYRGNIYNKNRWN